LVAAEGRARSARLASVALFARDTMNSLAKIAKSAKIAAGSCPYSRYCTPARACLPGKLSVLSRYAANTPRRSRRARRPYRAKHLRSEMRRRTRAASPFVFFVYFVVFPLWLRPKGGLGSREGSGRIGGGRSGGRRPLHRSVHPATKAVDCQSRNEPGPVWDVGCWRVPNPTSEHANAGVLEVGKHGRPTPT